MGVESARVTGDEQARLTQLFGLPTTLGPGAIEGNSIGGDAEDYDHRRPEERNLGHQSQSAGTDFARREFVGSSRCPVHDVGDPDAPRGQVYCIFTSQSPGGVDLPFCQASQVKSRVEAVAPFSEMGLSGGSPQPGVDTNKEQPQVIAEEIRDAAISCCLELGTAKAHPAQVRKTVIALNRRGMGRAAPTEILCRGR